MPVLQVSPKQNMGNIGAFIIRIGLGGGGMLYHQYDTDTPQ